MRALEQLDLPFESEHWIPIELRIEPCVCGTALVSPTREPSEDQLRRIVALHRESEPHRAWLARSGL